METQIKKIGSYSKGIIIPSEILKFKKLNLGDWVEVELKKIKRKEE